jgi:hypothetical protein
MAKSRFAGVGLPLVFVVKLTAVLNASAGDIPECPKA